jgi:hypothetical protein
MMDMEQISAALRRLEDRRAIEDVLVRYCRAVDRLDRELLLSCYHPDAIDDHGIFLGNPRQFADWAFSLHQKYQHVTQHTIGNITCELDGDLAHTETYYMYAGMNRQGTPLTVCGGRYIDRFERRQDRWAIADRMSILEWQGTPGEIFVRRVQVAADLHGHESRRDRKDPSYHRPLVIESKSAAWKIEEIPAAGARG